MKCQVEIDGQRCGLAADIRKVEVELEMAYGTVSMIRTTVEWCDPHYALWLGAMIGGPQASYYRKESKAEA